MTRVPLVVVTALTLAVCVPSAARAQETPTEREAARDVLQKLGALERSLDVPSIVKTLTAPNPAREKVVARAKQLMDTELLALGDDITKHPEESGSPRSGRSSC